MYSGLNICLKTAFNLICFKIYQNSRKLNDLLNFVFYWIIISANCFKVIHNQALKRSWVNKVFIFKNSLEILWRKSSILISWTKHYLVCGDEKLISILDSLDHVDFDTYLAGLSHSWDHIISNSKMNMVSSHSVKTFFFNDLPGISCSSVYYCFVVPRICDKLTKLLLMDFFDRMTLSSSDLIILWILRLDNKLFHLKSLLLIRFHNEQ